MKDIPIEYHSNNVHQAISHLIEEAGEVIAAGGKTLRFGLDSVNPELSEDKQESNIKWLMREIEDFEYAVGVLRAYLNS